MKCKHCQKPINEHKAGSETDACIAVVVFDHPMYIFHCPACTGMYFGKTKDKRYCHRCGWVGDPEKTLPAFSSDIAAAKKASDRAGCAVIFAPHSSVRDGSYANRKKEWLVEIIPNGGVTTNAAWSYGETEALARCRAALLLVHKEKIDD